MMKFDYSLNVDGEEILEDVKQGRMPEDGAAVSCGYCSMS
jgi:hypothetical protein